MTRLLFVSNGHGEDQIAAEVIRHLQDARVTAYPLVGTGDAYPEDVVRLDPRRRFLSGGFTLRGRGGLGADLRAGLIPFWLAQRKTIAAQRGRHDQVVAVGDTYCLYMAARAAGRAVLVASADSLSLSPFSPLERELFRRRALRVFTRDQPTAAHLASLGIPALCLGNPMLDCLHPQGVDLGLDGDRPVVVLLPGSRAEAAANAVLVAEAAARIARARPGTQVLIVLAPEVDGADAARALAHTGWEGTIADRSTAERSVGVQGEMRRGPARIMVTRAFPDAVARATVVIGLAGTANEQAAGLGVPVVAFSGPGPQFTGPFLDAQRKLLGEALVPTTSPEDAAQAVVSLLDDPAERSRRGEVGRARMGTPGAARRIARAIQDLAGGPRVQGRPTLV